MDLAGNPAVLPLRDDNAIVLDLSPPVVSNVEVTTPTAGGRVNLADCRSQRSVLVVFDVAEELPALPTHICPLKPNPARVAVLREAHKIRLAGAFTP